MDFFKAALNKVQDFVADSRVTTTTEIAKGVLAVAAQIGQAKIGGPLATASAVLGTMNVIQGVLKLDKVDIAAKWTEDNCTNGRHVGGPISEALEQAGAFKYLNPEVVAVHGEKHILRVLHEGKMAIFTRWGSGSKVSYSSHVWLEHGFNLSAFSEAIWKAGGGPVVKLSYHFTDSGSVAFDLLASDYGDVPYLGSHDVEEFNLAIEAYRSRGISRCALLVGAPGGGKSSFCRAYARHTGQNMLILTSDFMKMYKSSCEQLIRVVAPDILLIDDIDREPDNLSFAMAVIDTIRLEFPRMVIVTTVNQIAKTNAALLRPGRLGERIKFEAPTDPEKIELLKLYMARYEVNPAAFDLDVLVKAMSHKNFTADYVRFVAEQAVVLDQSKLLVSIANMVELLDIGEFMEPTVTGSRPVEVTSGMLGGLLDDLMDDSDDEDRPLL